VELANRSDPEGEGDGEIGEGAGRSVVNLTRGLEVRGVIAVVAVAKEEGVFCTPVRPNPIVVELTPKS